MNKKVIVGAALWKLFFTSSRSREKRKRALNIFVLAHIIDNMSNKIIPKIENYVEIIHSMSDGTFRTHFRLTRTAFEVILGYLAPCPEFHRRQRLLGGREQISVEKMLLVTLWTLGTPDSYRSIADRFNISKGTVVHILNIVVTAVLNHLCQRFVKWPSTIEEKRQNAAEFRTHGLPNIIGVIDGCHIPIRRPTENPYDYFNRKKYYSVVLQGICQKNLMFIDCDVRWPGSVHDSRVLRTSDFYPVAEQLCSPNYYILGDSAYPVQSWLISPFRNTGHLTPPQAFFNTQLSKTRVVIENAFALLKGRFRRLKYLEMKHISDVVRVTVCCCILHNICLLSSEEDILEYIHEGENEEHIPMVPGYNDHEARNDGEARDAMVDYVWNRRHRH